MEKRAKARVRPYDPKTGTKDEHEEDFDAKQIPGFTPGQHHVQWHPNRFLGF
jgi:hypothetical protein